MSQQVEGNVKTFTAGEALEAYRRVKLSAADTVVYSDAGEDWLGITQEAVANSAQVGVRLRTAAGTSKMTVAGVLSVNDVVYGAADGKIDDAPTGQPVGRALEAATADGGIVEVIPGCDLSQGGGDAVEVIGGAGGITALNLVYVSDQTDAIMTVLKAQATSGGRFADYICPNAIAAAAKGAALKVFLLQGIDTDAGAVGDPVYLSDSAAGGYTLVKPTGTDKVQIVGRIVEDDVSTGAILFDLSGPQQVVHDHSDNSEGGDLGDHNSGTITLGDEKNIVADTTTGSQIGTAANQKLALWGATPAVQQSHVADPAVCAEMTATLTGVDTGTDMTSAQAATIVADLAALKAAADANNAALDSILAQLAAIGLQASS